MAESLTTKQRTKIGRLGKWRDEGHLLAIGFNGVVTPYDLSDEGNDYEHQQWEWAAGSRGRAEQPGTSGQSGAAGSRRTEAEAQPPGEEWGPPLRLV